MGYPELYTNLFLPFSDAVFWAKIILDVPKRGEKEKRKKKKKKKKKKSCPTHMM